MSTPSKASLQSSISSSSLYIRDATAKRIMAAVPEHESLTASIKATIWTTHALSDSKAAAATISTRLRAAQDELLRLSMARTRRASTNDRQQQQDASAPKGIMKRMAGRVSGRKSSTSGAEPTTATTEEERAYLQLLRAERSAQDKVNGLRAELDEAEITVSTSAAGAEQHTSYLLQLEALFDSFFAPDTTSDSNTANTPSGFPEEEVASAAVRKARSPISRLEDDIASETTVLDYLRVAATEVAGALHSGRTANRWSKAADVPFVIGSNIVAGAGQKNSLESAAAQLDRARERTEDAREIQPLVVPLSFADVTRARDTVDSGPRQNALSEGALFRGNVGTLQPTVELTLDRCMKAQRAVDKERDAARERKKSLEKELRRARRDVEEKRKLLRGVRAAVFKQVAGVDVVGDGKASLDEDMEGMDSPRSEATLDEEDLGNLHELGLSDEIDRHQNAGQEQLPEYTAQAGV